MSASERFIPRGVIPAVLLPFDSDLQIDERGYRSHLRDVASVDGISGVTINAHASEVHALSFDEQKRVLASLVVGVDGLLSGAGSVIADLQAQLWRAVQAKDLGAAQGLNDRIWQITNVFYANPTVDMHNRMKEALVLLGRQRHAYVRPPLMKLSDREISEIRRALIRGGLLKE